MKWLGNILVVAFLLMAGLPCVHAGFHETHEHGSALLDLCAAHDCHCHDCAADACTDRQLAARDMLTPLVAAPAPDGNNILFTVTEKKPTVHRFAFPLRDALASLKTIRLLV